MKKIKELKKLLLIALCFLFALGSVHNVSANEIENEFIIENIPISELEEYPDVIEYLVDHNAYDEIISEYNYAVENQDELFLQLLNDGNEDPDHVPLTKDRMNEIITKYGLEEAVDEHMDVLLSKSYQLSVLMNKESKIIENVWYVYYTIDESGFSSRILTLNGPVDSISGTVKLYYMTAKTWSGIKKSTSFKKDNVGTSTYVTWKVPVSNVKEKFEYKITVTDSGTSNTYDNAGENDLLRFNFVSGKYSNISAAGGDRHHFISKNSLIAAGMSTTTAYCMRMTKEDHEQTYSYASSKDAVDFRASEKELLLNKEYQELLYLEVDGFEKVDDPDGMYSSLSAKYTDVIVECLAYYESYFGL